MREPLEIYATEAKFASNEAVYIFLQLETDKSFRALENANHHRILRHASYGHLALRSAQSDGEPGETLSAGLAVSEL